MPNLKINNIAVLKYLWLVFAVLPHFAYSQTTISGVVSDKVTGKELGFATITYGKGKGVSATFDGIFSFEAPNGKYTLITTYLGYKPDTTQVTATGGTIELNIKLSTVTLRSVEVVADIALARETPVAYTNVSAKKLKTEIGTQSIPMVLNSTPGVYATQSGGGDGDARINIRGFSQRKIAVMIDGVPMNDMENGWVYWSNWFGLDVVTQKIQVQRGLSANKLSVPAIGGSINILTERINKNPGGTVRFDVGNDLYLRGTASYNSGRLKGGWGVVGAVSAKMRNGWVDNLYSRGFFYFLKIQKQFGKHSLTLSTMGAPQQHAQRPFKKAIHYYDEGMAARLGADTAKLANKNFGRRYNEYWGYLVRDRYNMEAEEKILSARVNYYYKPVFNLKHFWAPSNKFGWSNIFYGSFGRGGGTRLFEEQIDTVSGQTDFNLIYNNNTSYVDVGFFTLPPYDTTVVNDTTQYKSKNYLTASENNHMWFGLISTTSWRPINDLELSFGIDARYYQTDRYNTIYDLLGGDYAVPNSNSDNKNEPDSIVKREGDIFDYNIRSYVAWAGSFAQAEYATDKYSVFLSGTFNFNAYNRVNYFGLKDSITGAYPSSGWKLYPGGSVKAGFNYNFNLHHNAFFNVGFISKPQLLSNAFIGVSLQTYSDLVNELIYAGELGYTYRNNFMFAKINGYYTIWKNKPVKKTVNIGGDPVKINIPGMIAHNRGVELYTEINPIKYISIEGAFSYGDWRWMSGATAYYTDELGTTVTDTVQFDATGVRVGDAAQMQVSVAIKIKPIKGLYIKPRITYFDFNYADFNPEDLTAAKGNQGRQSWRMPAYYLLDLHIGYSFPIKDKYRLGIRGSILNLTNHFYISDAQNNGYNLADETFDAQSATVFVGMGIRWSTNIYFKF